MTRFIKKKKQQQQREFMNAGTTIIPFLFLLYSIHHEM